MMFLVALGVLFAGAIGIFVMRNIAWHVNNRKRSEEALRSAHDELDDRVQQRTADLARANGALELEVAERKNAEAGLRESEERYRDLFENANDIIYTHDLEGNYTSINKTCEKIVGYTNEEALKMNIAQVVAPEYLEETWQLLARKTRGKTPSAYVLEVIAKDGHRVVLEVNSRLTHEHGKPTGVQGIARDITERKRIERKLKNSELQLNEAQRIAHVGSWEFEAATQELRWTDELRSEEHTSELQSLRHLVCRLLLEKKKNTQRSIRHLFDGAPADVRERVTVGAFLELFPDVGSTPALAGAARAPRLRTAYLSASASS